MSDSVEYPTGEFNVASFFVDRNITLGRGDRTAIICGDERYTYREIQVRVNKFGNVLKELGVEAENRVLLIINDTIDFPCAYYGIMKIGAVETDAYTYLKLKDYEYFLVYTKAKVVIVDDKTREIVAQAAEKSPYLKYILVSGKDPQNLRKNELSLEELLSKASPDLEAAPTTYDDVCQWKFTMGSTGQPKGVVHTHHNMWYVFEHYCKHVLNFTQEEVVLPVPKLFFGYARDATIAFTFGMGACGVIFPERTTVEGLFDLIEKHRPTVMVQVPSMMNLMALHPGASGRDLSSLRYCIASGESLPAEVYRRWKDTFGVEVLEAIGSAELYYVYASNTIDSIVPGSVGKMIPGYESRLVSETGEPVAVGDPGVLHIRGGSAGLCYFNDRNKSTRTFLGEWVNTGDLFSSDAGGNLFFSGRADHMMKVSGIWVAPAEIENCILQHDGVQETAVIPYEEIKGLVLPLAVVVKKEGALLNEGDIIAYVKNKLAPYKAPKKVVFLEEMPKTPAGKLDKKALKAMTW